MISFLINICASVRLLIWKVALNFGEILREFGEILGKYRMNQLPVNERNIQDYNNFKQIQMKKLLP